MLKPHKKTANVMYEREESVFDRVPNIMPALNNENTLSPELAENFADNSKSIFESEISAYNAITEADSEVTQKALNILSEIQAHEGVTENERVRTGEQVTQITTEYGRRNEQRRKQISASAGRQHSFLAYLGLLTTGGVVTALAVIGSNFRKKR